MQNETQTESSKGLLRPIAPKMNDARCPYCGGRGEVMAFSWESKTGYKPCPKCKGVESLNR